MDPDRLADIAALDTTGVIHASAFAGLDGTTFSNAPNAGTIFLSLTRFGDLEIGVWEMSVGTMTDVEVDEVFVVLSGAATVEFADGTAALRLRAGDIGRLAAGAETTWTVTETLRKIYLS